jgi:hypothetical protein
MSRHSNLPLMSDDEPVTEAEPALTGQAVFPLLQRWRGEMSRFFQLMVETGQLQPESRLPPRSSHAS